MELYRLFSDSGDGEYYCGLFKSKETMMEYLKKEFSDSYKKQSISDDDFIVSERGWNNPNKVFFTVLIYTDKEHFGEEDWEDDSYGYEVINTDNLT
jgi:hypothetical protein